MTAPLDPGASISENAMSRSRRRSSGRLAKQSLLALARRELARARRSSTGVSVRVIEPGSQTAPRVVVAAITAGEGLDVGEEDGAWCLHLLEGQVRARQANLAAAALPGDLLTGTCGWRIHAKQDAALLVVTTAPTDSRRR